MIILASLMFPDLPGKLKWG